MSATETVQAAPSVYNRKQPFSARLRVRRSLTGSGSGKDTRHLEIDLTDSGLVYSPGDSLGVLPRNPKHLVREVTEALKLAPDTVVTLPSGASMPFEEALSTHFTLNRANRKIMHAVAERVQTESSRQRVNECMSTDTGLAEYLFTRDFVDVLREFPDARFESAQDFLKVLSPIQPRLYSIASSLAVHPNSVHLCVAVVRYETHGRAKLGLASGFLAEEATLNAPEIPVYVQESPKFFLPSDPSRDIIMVGPGTGIAPFRAFLEQRTHDQAQGRNWLFFGEQHASTDFLYAEDLHRFQKQGTLHRLDLAFSRDQAEKIYVQHRMKERAAELWEWISNGAYFYVCGDARRMAKDVHHALIQIVQEQGKKSLEEATTYVEQTLAKTERRYLRDVY